LNAYRQEKKRRGRPYKSKPRIGGWKKKRARKGGKLRAVKFRRVEETSSSGEEEKGAIGTSAASGTRGNRSQTCEEILYLVKKKTDRFKQSACKGGEIRRGRRRNLLSRLSQRDNRRPLAWGGRRKDANAPIPRKQFQVPKIINKFSWDAEVWGSLSPTVCTCGEGSRGVKEENSLS